MLLERVRVAFHSSRTCAIRPIALSLRHRSPALFEGQLVQLASLPWIGTPPASVRQRMLARLFTNLGVRQQIVRPVDKEASMIAMTRTGIGLSLCRDRLPFMNSSPMDW